MSTFTVTVKQIRYATLVIDAPDARRAGNVALNVISNADFDAQNPEGETGDTSTLEIAIGPDAYYGTHTPDARSA